MASSRGIFGLRERSSITRHLRFVPGPHEILLPPVGLLGGLSRRGLVHVDDLAYHVLAERQSRAAAAAAAVGQGPVRLVLVIGFLEDRGAEPVADVRVRALAVAPLVQGDAAVEACNLWTHGGALVCCRECAISLGLFWEDVIEGLGFSFDWHYGCMIDSTVRFIGTGVGFDWLM